MRHKKEHHKTEHKMDKKTHKMVEKHHERLEKMITETKRHLGIHTGGELKAKPHTARRVGEGVKGEEHPVREKRAYNKRKK